MVQPKPPKLTDEQRHARFVETAHAVEASEDPKDFEDAFIRVADGSAKQPERE